MDQELIKFINCFDVPVRVVEVDSRRQPFYCAFNEAALLDAGVCHDDIYRRTARDIYPGVIGEIAHNRHLKVIETGMPLTFDLDEDAPDGTNWLRITLAPVTNDEGAVVRILCTQVDVTAEKRMQHSESDAEQRIREMESYIALAAHDLRTPMVNVRLIAEYLKDDFKDLGDGKLQMIESLETISNKAMLLISDVLAHAQATTKRESRAEIFQLTDVCSDLLTVLDPMGHSTLVSNDALIAADKIAVRIAIGNLLDNALKHNAGVALQLSITITQKSTEFMEICVADNGKGFGDSSISFFDTGNITSNCGFGLVGVSRLVRERGGYIHAESRSDCNGAVICFSLPGTVLSSGTAMDVAVGE